MSKKRCRRGHRNRSAVGVTRITVDVGHPNQVNPHRCQSPKLPQNVRFHETPRSQNHRSRISVNGDDWHAQKLFVNVVVIVCSVIVLCAQGMDLSRQHGFGGPPVGRFRPVKRAIDEGDIGRQEGEPRKAVSAGIRGKELIASMFYIVCCIHVFGSL